MDADVGERMMFTVVAIAPQGKSRTIQIVTFHVVAHSHRHAVERVEQSGMKFQPIACFYGALTDELAKETIKL